MFESAELGHTVTKASYARQVPKLREALLDAQYDLLEKKSFSTLILISGVDGAGKGETVNLLNEWMDPRHVHTHAMSVASDEEQQHPRNWRFWRALPPRGKIGVFFGSWYTYPIVRRAYGEIKDASLDQAMEEIVRLERMLADERVLVLKLWFHLSKKQQKRRLLALSADKRTRWRVTESDWKHFEIYDTFRRVSERALRQTSTADAPWRIIEGADARYRSLTAGRIVLESMRTRLSQTRQPRPFAPPPAKPDEPNLLRALDLSQKVSDKRYDKELEALQGRLNLLTRHPKWKKTGVVAVFEGADAAGKGGAIRRITGALDARQYRIVPVAAPTEEERAQPYLWRFWRNVPAYGQFVIFDRSWYGRVLVERVEGFCEQHDWNRAYSEINDFEEQLSGHGLVVVKFWLHIDADEQLRRFKEREATGFKRFKITAEDWRNRKKWKDYEVAACNMFERTSTEIAPWTLVPAVDKRFARIRILETICDRLEEQIKKG
ncbi:MAG: polyphosphate:AMP phosphotransferase [Polyangiaceae bacterium]|nr:polyphosphate:AMP phosphotransferase [Polyangiaceae bacterium]